MERNKQYYEDFFKKYDFNVHDDPVRFSKISSLCKGEVLDVACGTGTLSEYYQGMYTGLDISEKAIELAKHHRRNDAKFFVAPATAEWKSRVVKYDTIVLAEFLEHVESDTMIFKNVMKVIKPNGRLIISVPNGDKVPDESHARTFTIPKLRKRFSSVGRVRFYNFPGAEARIIMTIDLGQKNLDLISVVIPAKNEELGLETAVLSCLDFADNIVISVDKSSTDKTLTIAKNYADVLKEYDWEESFCKMRMFAQEGVKTKWVLALDGHEHVEQAPDIEKHLSAHEDGLEVKVVLESGFTFHFPRLIKSGIGWDADVHNFPRVKSRKFYSEFLILHDRENLQSKDAVKIRDKQRKKMVIEIMEEEIKKNPKNVRPYFYLAQQHFISKDFKPAIKAYKKYLKLAKDRNERWLVCYEIAHAYAFRNRNWRALMWLRNAEKELPRRWEVYKMRGVILAVRGIHEPALKCFADSMCDQNANFTYYPERRDNAETWDYMGWSLYQLGKIKEAKVAWNRAIELETKKEKKFFNQNRIKTLSRMVKL